MLGVNNEQGMGWGPKGGVEMGRVKPPPAPTPPPPCIKLIFI